MEEFRGLFSMKELENLLLVEGVVLDAERLTLAQILLEARDSGLRTNDLHLIATRHDAYIGVLVLEAKDIDIVHTIESGGVECFVEREDGFHRR